MGNTLISAQTSSQLLAKYWQPLSPGIYRNRATQEVIEERRLGFRTEEEMRYVFGCLLKRMNNGNANVVKVVYLRQVVETASVCNCMRSFVVLVYLERLEYSLGQFVSQYQNSDTGKQRQSLSQYQSKCICLHLIKGAQYLMEKYGPFRVTPSNVWLELPKNVHQLKSSQKELPSTSSKIEYVQNLKLKLWISAQKEQNFPDESCEEKDMVLSIVELIQSTFLPSKLCKCYRSAKDLEKYLTVHKLKDLAEKIKQGHSSESDSCKLNKDSPKPEVLNNNVPFQRTVRSFSSNDPGHHTATLSNNRNHNEQFQLIPERKYTSIEFVRKPIDDRSVRVDKNLPQSPQVISEMNQLFSPTSKTTIQQNQPKHSSFQQKRTYQNHQKNDHSMTKNEHNKVVFQLQNPSRFANNSKITPPNHQQKSPQLFNPKMKYRHGNMIYNRPIVEIEDLSAKITSQVPLIVSGDKKMQEDQATQKGHSQSYMRQLDTERENGQRMANMVLEESIMSKRQVEISLDKGTNPTDRTKNEVESKGEEKRQGEGISSSRKQISVIPISLESTYGAASSLRPVLHSNDHMQRPISTPVSNSQLEISANLQVKHHHFQETKKQSVSSSKSEQNHFMTYQVHLPGGNTVKEDRGAKFVPIKREHHEQSNGKSTERRHQEPEVHRQKAHSFLHKIETLAEPNGDMGRLRQSEYIISAQNSFMNSKSMSVKQSNCSNRQEEKNNEIGSLAEMEANFPTVNDLAQLQEIGVQKSQKYFFRKEDDKKVHEAQKTNQRPVESGKRSNLVTVAEHPKKKSQSSNPSDPRARVPTEQIQQIISGKVSSLMMRENEEPLVMQKVTEEEYRVKIRANENFQGEKQKMHQKKLSNPTFDKQYMKNKSLKEEFGNVLDFPKENSFKALTESKDKFLTLEQNEGRETYSIYNESEYNTSEQASKRQSQHEGAGKPAMPQKEQKQGKWRKPFSKEELERELLEKKGGDTTKNNEQPTQQMLRLTSSGHEDNSIKQKVRIKKAEFAELKNEMNSLLF